MVDDLEERLSRYRADLDAAVAADLARRHPTSGETGFNDADPLLLDIDYPIRLEPTRSAPSDRRRVMIVATLGVAAAVAALVVVGVAVSGDEATPADQPSSTVTAPPATPPRVLRKAPSTPEPIVPGTYFVGLFDGGTSPQITVTLGPGWSVDADGLITSKHGRMTFSRPGAVFSDACHPSEGNRPGPVTTFDGLVAALSEQRGWADVTTPSDISVDGYAGKAFQRTAPVDMSDCDASGSSPGLPADFSSWAGAAGGALYEPGEIETVWVLDVGSRVVVVNTRAFRDASAADRAELAAVLDSIRFDQG